MSHTIEEEASLIARRYKELTDNAPAAIGHEEEPAPNPKAALPVFKVYQDVPRYPLTWPTESEKAGAEADNYTRLSHILSHTLGLNLLLSLPQQNVTFGLHLQTESFINGLLRRNVPSGGALYPSELYVWLNNSWEQPAGFYHYDPAHHQLALLREGDFATNLEKVLGVNLAETGAIIFGSLRLTKNVPKYRSLTYRLQALDSGIVQGRLAQLAQVSDVPARLVWQFDDMSLNALLGLDTENESVYHATLLDINGSKTEPSQAVAESNITEIAPAYNHNPLEPTLTPTLREIHLQSLYDATKFSRAYRATPLRLPSLAPDFDLPAATKTRYSNGAAYDLKAIPAENLLKMARHAQNTVEAVRQTDSPLDIELYFLVTNVSGMEQGAYRYNPVSDSLEGVIVPYPNLALKLMETNFYYQVAPFNPYAINATFYAVGSYEQSFERYSTRGFRLLNLAAGCVVDAVEIAAGASGLDSGNYLGYSATSAGELLGLKPEKSALMQLFIGKSRPNSAVYYSSLA